MVGVPERNRVVGGFRILRDVGFHAGVAVTGHGQCATHEHDLADFVFDFRSFFSAASMLVIGPVGT